MRKILVAANWKMNKTIAESEAFASALRSRLGEAPSCELLVFPPFLAVGAVARALDGSGVGVGAQDLFWEPSGAFTGEVSGAMIADAGATRVLVGHSERRHVIGEDDALVNAQARRGVCLGAAPDSLRRRDHRGARGGTGRRRGPFAARNGPRRGRGRGFRPPRGRL